MVKNVRQGFDKNRFLLATLYLFGSMKTEIAEKDVDSYSYRVWGDLDESIIGKYAEVVKKDGESRYVLKKKHVENPQELEESIGMSTIASVAKKAYGIDYNKKPYADFEKIEPWDFSDLMSGWNESVINMKLDYLRKNLKPLKAFASKLSMLGYRTDNFMNYIALYAKDIANLTVEEYLEYCRSFELQTNVSPTPSTEYWNSEMYQAVFGNPRKFVHFKKTWEEISGYHKDVLLDSTRIKRKYDAATGREKLTLCGPMICKMILENYKDVDSEVYYKLLSAIYSTPDIARMLFSIEVNDDNSYRIGGSTFLELTLMNPILTLNEEQKEFAIKEALSGAESYEKSDTLLPALILTNENWSDEEKKAISERIFPTNEEWGAFVIQCESSVKQEIQLLSKKGIEFTIEKMYDFDKTTIIGLSSDANKTTIAWQHLENCRKLHAIRAIKPIDKGKHKNPYGK